MHQIDRNRVKVQTLSTRQKKKEKEKKKKSKKIKKQKEEDGKEGKDSRCRDGGGGGGAASSSDVDLHPEYIQNFMKLLDPTEFLVTNSMYTFGRACTVSIRKSYLF